MVDTNEFSRFVNTFCIYVREMRVFIYVNFSGDKANRFFSQKKKNHKSPMQEKWQDWLRHLIILE